MRKRPKTQGFFFASRNLLVVWRHLRRRFGERRSRVADESSIPARPIVGRVAGTPAERVAVAVVSSPAPASRVASAKVWTWFRRVRPINPLGFSLLCECDPSWWKKWPVTELPSPDSPRRRRERWETYRHPVRKRTHGRWHLCHPDLVNNHPPLSFTSPLLHFGLGIRGLDLLRVHFPRRRRSWTGKCASEWYRLNQGDWVRLGINTTLDRLWWS